MPAGSLPGVWGADMSGKIYNKSQLVGLKDLIAKREITVRIVTPSQRPMASSPIDEVEMAKAYAKEGRISKPLNLAQCMTAGVAIGLFLCVISAVIGTRLNGGDIAAIIGAPALLGLIAGYLLS